MPLDANPSKRYDLPMGRVRAGVASNAPANSPTQINFDVESFDAGNLVATLPTQAPFVAPTDGVYGITCSMGFGGGSPSDSHLGIRIAVNGAEISAVAFPQVNAAFAVRCACFDQVVLKQGDTVGMIFFHNRSASASTLTLVEIAPVMSVHFVGPA